jgi:shikimate kinase/3-dehydroquinate synthase
MGTGKSTVGPLAAARLGIPYVDTDEIVAREAGASIPDLWKREGEARFRERERIVVERLLAEATPHVVSLGGGALLSRDLRHAVLDRAIVVTLTSEPAEILSRIRDISQRPNLSAADPIRRVRELLDARADAYAECHASLSTDGVDVDDTAEAACAVVRRDPIVLPLGARSYAIDVVRDSPEALTDAIARLAPSSLVVVTDAVVRRARHVALDRALTHLALPRIDVTLSHGEEQKTLSTVSTIWDAALGAGIDRDAIVVAFGGGVTGDLAGFAASTLLRGIRFVSAPTTLLAMVDASVGGKTGFDHPAGKNLVGSIHQPSAVVVDSSHLATLPAREMRAGLAEVVKIALATSAPLFTMLEKNADALLDPNSETLTSVIREAITLKARIVRDDERDHGRRALLNLGHTIGHTLEAHGRYKKYLHGEAVALGLVAELAATTKRELTAPDVLSRTKALLTALGLATDVAAQELHAAARFVGADKKRRGGSVALPIVTAVGRAEVRLTPPERLYEG